MIRSGGAAVRITLVIPSLGSGGAERVMSVLAGMWAARGEEVTLVTSEPAAEDFYPLHPAVRQVSLELPAPAGPARKAKLLPHVLRIAAGLRREIRASRPDVVVSFMEVTNILALVATRGLRVPVIVSERTDPRQYGASRIWRSLRRRLYPRAAAVVVQTESVREWALEFLAAERVHVIPNPVLAPPPAGKLPPGFPAGPLVVAMGRLHSDKGFDLLLRAVAPSLERHPEWSLVVLGEGPDRAALEALARELGIAGRVRFPGRVAAPDAVLRHAALFVLSSRFEGFPNALVEAMACGVAVVSTDCRSGPAEIVRQGVDGVLVPPGDPEALGAAVERLISDPAERERLAARAPEVVARFGAEGVLEMWNERIRACVA